jgi:hypothetical protein
MNRDDMMRGLKIVSLGIAIWGLTLFWPDLNRGLIPWAMTKVALGLGLVSLTYLSGRYFSRSEQIIALVEVAVPTRDPNLGLIKSERS